LERQPLTAGESRHTPDAGASFGAGAMLEKSTRTPTRTSDQAALIAMHECSAYIPDMSGEDSKRARQRQARYEREKT